jgi:hypothetical protein
MCRNLQISSAMRKCTCSAPGGGQELAHPNGVIAKCDALTAMRERPSARRTSCRRLAPRVARRSAVWAQLKARGPFARKGTYNW